MDRKRRRIGVVVVLAMALVIALFAATTAVIQRGGSNAALGDGLAPGPNRGFQDADDVARLVEFLGASPLLIEGDGKFHNGEGPAPTSFVSDVDRFWGDFVCGMEDCAVTDVVRNEPFSLLGEDLDGIAAARQVERVLASTGANIYDASVWQMAVALAADVGTMDRSTAEELVAAQRARLRRLDSRASADFTYQGRPTADNPAERYAVRFLGPSFFVTDPFVGTGRNDLVGTAVPPGDPLTGKISWPDWKPISGENAWAFLIGSLQASYLLYGSEAAAIPPDDPAVLDAVTFLEPLAALQSPTGAVLHAADQSLGNDGSPIPAGTVSMENLISIVAGLRILDDILAAQSGADGVDAATVSRNAQARAKIATLLHGAGDRPGLIPFFRTNGLSKAGTWIVQGGVVSGSTFVDAEANPETDDFAVDVNTWGVAALSPAAVDEWWGPGTAYEIWLETRQRGGFFRPDGALAGVGYTTNAEADQQVLSGEWSFGALLMLRSLIQHYESGGSDGGTNIDIAGLERDVMAIEQAMLDLRTDRYHDASGGGTWSSFPDGIPPEFGTTLPDGQLAFLYSSKRVAIPFGWFGNPIPSTASSAWAMLWSYWYNPFALGGIVGPVSWTPPSAEELRLADTAVVNGAPILTVVNGTSDARVAIERASAAASMFPSGSFDLVSLTEPVTVGVLDAAGAGIVACTIEPNAQSPRSLTVTVVDGPGCQ